MIVQPSARFEVHKIESIGEFWEFLETKGFFLDIQPGSTSGVVSDRPGPGPNYSYFRVGEYFFTRTPDYQQFFIRDSLEGFDVVA